MQVARSVWSRIITRHSCESKSYNSFLFQTVEANIHKLFSIPFGFRSFEGTR